MTAIALALVSILVSSNVLADDPLSVQLDEGKIYGHTLKSFWGSTTYYAFQEIPYAAPPVGADRFKPPRSPDPWDGVLDTTQNTKQCVQIEKHPDPKYEQTEDCLYLNVYTPQAPGSNYLLPVVVWIHGGSFVAGNGNIDFYNPGRFIDSQLVVVTFNYRLGPFGFLTTQDGVISGNLGLKDQRFAIEWVQRNIQLFGGDPDKITIAGADAGAASVGYQLTAKDADGLFVGVVQQSGSPVCADTFTVYAKKYAFDLGTLLDSTFHSTNSTELLKLLKKHTSKEIITAAQKVHSLEGNVTGYMPGMIWLPVIENATVDESALILAAPFVSMYIGNFPSVPILIGSNSEESLAFKNDSDPLYPAIAALWDANPGAYIDGIKLRIAPENLTAAGQDFKNFYTNSSYVKDNAAFVKYSSDGALNFGVHKQAKLASTYTDVYVYRFSYVGELPQLPFGRFKIEGCGQVGHGEELDYLWNHNTTEINDADLYTTAKLLQIYRNFAYTQNPTPEPQYLLDGITWPTLGANADAYEFVDIGRYLSIHNKPRGFEEGNDILKKYINGPF